MQKVDEFCLPPTFSFRRSQYKMYSKGFFGCILHDCLLGFRLVSAWFHDFGFGFMHTGMFYNLVFGFEADKTDIEETDVLEKPASIRGNSRLRSKYFVKGIQEAM